MELHPFRVVPHPGSCALPRVDLRFLNLWVSLQNFQSFTFDDAQQENRKVGAYQEVKGQGRVAPGGGAWWSCYFFYPQRLAELLVSVLEQGLPPSHRVTWLQSIRILSRDRSCLDTFTSSQSLQALARHAGIFISEGSVSEPLDMDVVLESLKCLCNLVLSSPVAQMLAAEARLVVRLAERVGLSDESSFPHDVQFFDLRLLFLLTALRVDVRRELFQELQGVRLLTDALERTLGVSPKGRPPELLPPPEAERAMEVLKVLFNITFDSVKREVDEVRLTCTVGCLLNSSDIGTCIADEHHKVSGCSTWRGQEARRCRFWASRKVSEGRGLQGFCCLAGGAKW